MSPRFKWNHAKVNGKETPEYNSWRSMMRRCQTPDASHARWYSGVVVCERWHDYEAFLSDMGPRPDGTTLDRYPDKTGNYEPGNCRWATPKQQSNNHSGVVTINIGNFTGSIDEWCRALKRNRATVDTRLARGWTPYEALFEPIQIHGR